MQCCSCTVVAAPVPLSAIARSFDYKTKQRWQRPLLRLASNSSQPASAATRSSPSIPEPSQSHHRLGASYTASVLSAPPQHLPTQLHHSHDPALLHPACIRLHTPKCQRRRGEPPVCQPVLLRIQSSNEADFSLLTLPVPKPRFALQCTRLAAMISSEVAIAVVVVVGVAEWLLLPLPSPAWLLAVLRCRLLPSVLPPSPPPSASAPLDPRTDVDRLLEHQRHPRRDRGQHCSRSTARKSPSALFSPSSVHSPVSHSLFPPSLLSSADRVSVHSAEPTT